MDEQFEVIGCTIYNDYEEEVDTYMDGDLVIERYEVDSVWIEQLVITVRGDDNDDWDGWLEDAENDDFETCFIQIAEDGWDYANLCNYEEASPESLQCGAGGDNAELLTTGLISAAAFSLF